MKNKQSVGIAKRLNLLNEFIHAINKCETKQEVYDYLASELSNLITADHASISIIDKANKNLETVALFGSGTSRIVGEITPMNKTASCIALSRQETYITDYPNSNCSKCAVRTECESLEKGGYAAGMTTPIYIKNQAIGTIHVASYSKNVYTQKVQKIFETIALLVSACLEKIYFIETIGSSKSRINIHAKRLKALTKISVKLSCATSEENLLQIICDYFTGGLSTKSLSYVLVDEKHQKFTRTHFYSEGKLLSRKKTFPMDKSVLTRAVKAGTVEYYNDINEIESIEMQERGINHVWSIPVFKNNAMPRLLNLGWSVEPRYKDGLADIFNILGTLIEATLENIKVNEQLSYKANYDLLTSTYNRHSFQEKITNLINEKPVKPFTLLLADLDGFKQLNDFHGHLFGDKVLAEAGKHFQTIFGKKCFVARLGGDEFAIIGDFTGYKPGRLNGMKLNSIKVEHNSRIIPINFSIGVSQYPKHAQSSTKLMKYADLALYEAKISSSKITVFNNVMAKQYDHRYQLLNEFKAALSNGEIVPFYQPIIDLKTQKVHALEALMRWDHKKHGILSPADFSDVFEVPELSGKIAYVMHRRICKDMAQWKRNGVEFNQVALNVEPVNLVDPAFPLNLISELHENGLKPSEYAIEITENSILDGDNECIIEILNSLRLAGMSIVLDDFGTGFSSMSHLLNLPITTVKLDKSFVSEGSRSTKKLLIAKAIIGLTKALDLKTVAEGIETKNAKNLLVYLESDYGQGFLFSKPLPAEKIPEFINNFNNKKTKMLAAESKQAELPEYQYRKAIA